MHTPEAVTGDFPSRANLRAVVADPVVSRTSAGWQVGQPAPLTALDPAAVRAARLDARLAVYAQYAAVVAEEAVAVASGDEARRAELASARGAAAEHFTELRESAELDRSATVFSDALTDALHELRHQDAVDDALGRRLRALHDAAHGREIMSALPTGPLPVHQLDVRF